MVITITNCLLPLLSSQPSLRLASLGEKDRSKVTQVTFLAIRIQHTNHDAVLLAVKRLSCKPESSWFKLNSQNSRLIKRVVWLPDNSGHLGFGHWDPSLKNERIVSCCPKLTTRLEPISLKVFLVLVRVSKAGDMGTFQTSQGLKTKKKNSIH